MSKRSSEPDEVQSAVRAMNEVVSRYETPLPADVEAAWAEWSRTVQKVDARTMALLRAAFEVGVEAANQTTSEKRK